MNNELFEYYLDLLNYNNLPEFLLKYLEVPSLNRLKDIGYFCGMDYASKNIYNFSQYISRYNHSLSVALLTYKLTKDKQMTIAGLFHDIATPCFSHVIDYMNNDYEMQESTEEYTEKILKSDYFLLNCFKSDNINVDDIINFKRYSIVDSSRPKLCADRLDGIILTDIGWTKMMTKKDIKNIINSLDIYKNEDGEFEIGFKNFNIAKKVLEVNNNIDVFCHSKEDNYMMQLLADITKKAILKKYISYDDLYQKKESELFNIFENSYDEEILEFLDKFRNINLNDIPTIKLPKTKIRKINPLVNEVRLN